MKTVGVFSFHWCSERRLCYWAKLNPLGVPVSTGIGERPKIRCRRLVVLRRATNTTLGRPRCLKSCLLGSGSFATLVPENNWLSKSWVDCELAASSRKVTGSIRVRSVLTWIDSPSFLGAERVEAIVFRTGE